MALFGYPIAQENDAERAVRAALAIQRALDELNARNAGKNAPQLVARIGLESGQVVVDATSAVFGEAPNVAARVQSLAEPGSVIVTAESSAKSRASSSQKTVARMGSKVCRLQSRSIALYARAAAADGPAGA